MLPITHAFVANQCWRVKFWQLPLFVERKAILFLIKKKVALLSWCSCKLTSNRCIGNFTKCQILKIHRFLKYRFYLNNKWYLQAFQSFSSMSKYFKFSSDFSQFSSDFSQFLHKIFTIFFSKSVRRNLDFLCQIYFHINNICGFYFIKQFYWINSKKTDQFIRF